ncbi:MAG: hypothetical protein P8X98_14545 [Woeseiaceae bacterium]
MRTTVWSVLAGTILLPALAAAGPSAKVINGNDNGPGSLRAALMSGASTIVIDPTVDLIDLEAPLYYNGTTPLTINGSGQTIDGFGLGLEAMLTISHGADLSVRNLTFDAGGGDEDGPWERLVNEGGGKAIYVDIPADATGLVQLDLNNVTVLGTGNHGIHVSDCLLETEDGGEDPDSCGDGNSGEGEGSAASVSVRLNNVLVQRSGFGTQDADGVRVDERGYGDIYLSANNSTFDKVGADGIELDEGGYGSVYVDVRHVSFTENGEYCLINEFVPGDDCDDDGDPDVDDGFDIDEEGPGSVVGKIRNVNVIENYDEGLDFDEAGPGGADLSFIDVTSIDNVDEGIKVSEEDEGDNRARLVNVYETGDLEFEEAGDGSIEVSLNASWIGDDYKFVEENAGIVDLTINSSDIFDELEIEAVDPGPETIDAFLRARGSTIGEIDLVDGTSLLEY